MSFSLSEIVRRENDDLANAAPYARLGSRTI